MWIPSQTVTINGNEKRVRGDKSGTDEQRRSITKKDYIIRQYKYW